MPRLKGARDARGQRGAKGREAIDVWRGSLDGGARAESRVVVLLRKHHPANSRKSAVFEARGCAELQMFSDTPPALRTRVRYENGRYRMMDRYTFVSFRN